MLKATFKRHQLRFISPGGTSRGVLHSKPSWYIRLEDERGHTGYGEVSLIPGLSMDDENGMDHLLEAFCRNVNTETHDYSIRYKSSPAVVFAIECALKGLESSSPFILYDSEFTRGNASIGINGLIWMGDITMMNEQIEAKIEQGFSCLKMKIGALNFDDELRVIRSIRKRFSKDALELRVDANGAFQPDEAMDKLHELAKMHLHSIEQPIQARQTEEMYSLCRHTPLPIALDEELIGIGGADKAGLLSAVQPQYIILKPSLTGGMASSMEWIEAAEARQVGWWVTSALEGNVGLNAIAQWTYTLGPQMPQGLGTGQVFSNNIDCPLFLRGDQLCYNPETQWSNPFNAQ